MNKKEEFLQRLADAGNETTWNAICDEVKAYTKTLPEEERSGDYPLWWFKEVILTGLVTRMF